MQQRWSIVKLIAAVARLDKGEYVVKELLWLSWNLQKWLMKQYSCLQMLEVMDMEEYPLARLLETVVWGQ
jgi:hypothetical protein